MIDANDDIPRQAGTPQRITTIIVDDEPLARERLSALLAGDKRFAVVDQCGDGALAITAIESRRPQVVFLDIQMPMVSGFDVLAALEPACMPLVVFVTAFDQHAVRAFEVHALDYLLKPFDRPRFAATLDRIERSVREDQTAAMTARTQRLLSNGAPTAIGHRIIVRSGGRVLFVNVDEIDWLESAGNYVKLHVRGQTHLHRCTLAGMAQRLPIDRFVRIHRCAMINTSSLRAMERTSTGESVVVLSDGHRHAVSRRRRQDVQAILATRGPR